MRSFLIALLLVSCASRRELDESLAGRTERFHERVRANAGSVHRAFDERLAMHVEGAADGTFDILALSGGGPLGAFGAGFLQGWKDRPKEFDVVTGVSTGALIAPFAFLGTEESLSRIVELFRNPKDDWISLRIFGALFASKSFIDPEGLHRDIRAEITPELLARVAKARASHRTLLVGATDLDLGQLRIWNLTDVASRAELTRFQDQLLASSAIPGVFPPVELDGHLYADGGISAQFVFGIDTTWMAAAIRDWQRRRPGVRLPRFRFWVIMNNKLGTAPAVVQPSWAGVAERSLKIVVRYAGQFQLHAAIKDAEAMQRDLNVSFEVRFVAIPNDYPETKTSTDIFKQEEMRSLVELGRRMGADPSSWQDSIPNPEWPVSQNASPIAK